MNTVTACLLIADGNKLVTDGIRSLLGSIPEIHLILDALTGSAIIEQARQHQPDVVVLEMDLPDMSGIDVLKTLRQIAPRTKVLLLCESAVPSYIFYALQNDIAGYLVKRQVSCEILRHAVRTVLNGNRYFCAEATRIIAEHQDNRTKYRELTLREIEIGKLLACGLTLTKIGERLHISPRTVETHQRNIMNKLCLTNSAELIRYAIQQKW